MAKAIAKARSEEACLSCFRSKSSCNVSRITLEVQTLETTLAGGLPSLTSCHRRGLQALSISVDPYNASDHK